MLSYISCVEYHITLYVDSSIFGRCALIDHHQISLPFNTISYCCAIILSISFLFISLSISSTFGIENGLCVNVRLHSTVFSNIGKSTIQQNERSFLSYRFSISPNFLLTASSALFAMFSLSEAKNIISHGFASIAFTIFVATFSQRYFIIGDCKSLSLIMMYASHHSQ